jgi:CheY-like chemotaxis protein
MISPFYKSNKQALLEFLTDSRINSMNFPEILRSARGWKLPTLAEQSTTHMQLKKILLVLSNSPASSSMKRSLNEFPWQDTTLQVVHSIQEAEQVWPAFMSGLILIDLELPDIFDFIQSIRKHSPSIVAIIPDSPEAVIAARLLKLQMLVQPVLPVAIRMLQNRFPDTRTAQNHDRTAFHRATMFRK